MAYGDYYWGFYRDYYRDPFAHSLLSTREPQPLDLASDHFLCDMSELRLG